MIKASGVNILVDQDKKQRKLLQILVGQQLTEIRDADQIFQQLKDFTTNPEQMDLDGFKKEFTKKNEQTGFNPVHAILENNFLPSCIASFGITKWEDRETEDLAVKYAYRDKCPALKI